MTTDNAYSRAERILHHVAFGGLTAQKALAEMEESLFKSQLDALRIDRPVFVTSLPRAGTTLLLEVIVASGGFATHTYRDMPFVLCPMLWHRLSRSFRKPQSLRERAHGDGMQVGYDSPEAFEEVAWTAHWQSHYQPDHITPWRSSDRNDEFEHFLRAHLKKIIALRHMASGHEQPLRYISKNNANVARIELLKQIFPDAIVVVPFRNPYAHVGSMLNQHKRFLQRHAEDHFSRRYMEWLGHFEFGAALRPIDFDQWLEYGETQWETTQQTFWLRYWLAAYRHLLARHDTGLVFVDYDHLCREPATILAKLGDALALDDTAALINMASRFRSPTSYEARQDQVSDALNREIIETYTQLQEHALTGDSCSAPR